MLHMRDMLCICAMHAHCGGNPFPLSFSSFLGNMSQQSRGIVCHVFTLSSTLTPTFQEHWSTVQAGHFRAEHTQELSTVSVCVWKAITFSAFPAVCGATASLGLTLSSSVPMCVRARVRVQTLKGDGAGC